mgnify:CR=1 FL=1
MYKRLLHISPYFNSEKLKIWKHPPLKNPVQSVSISGHEKLLPNNLNNVSLLGNRLYKSSLQLSRRVKVELELASCIPRNRQSSPQRVEGEICRSSVSLGEGVSPVRKQDETKMVRENRRKLFLTTSFALPLVTSDWCSKKLAASCCFDFAPDHCERAKSGKGPGGGSEILPREKRRERKEASLALFWRGAFERIRAQVREKFSPRIVSWKSRYSSMKTDPLDV